MMFRRIAFLGAVGAAVLAVGAPPAAAHVTVHSNEAVQGASAEIAFRVPTESATASTVKLRVAFPSDQLIESVSVRPHPGWTYRVTTAPIEVTSQHSGHQHSGPAQAVSEIEWSVVDAAAGIKPGEYDSFTIAAGPMPDASQVVFRVVQTYSDGEIARWIDLPTSSAEPEHPAPVLSISAPDQKARTVAAVSQTTPTEVWWALVMAGVALLLALGGVGIALRNRSSS
jgi:uncharacterized protein YcnI